MAEYDGRIRMKTEFDTSDVKSFMSKVRGLTSSVSSRIHGMRDQFNSFAGEIGSKGRSAFGAMKEAAGDFADGFRQGWSESRDEAVSKAESLRERITGAFSSMKRTAHEYAESFREGFRDGFRQAASQETILGKLKRRIGELFSRMKAGLRSVGPGNGLLAQFGKKLFEMAKAAFIFGLISKAFSAMVQGIGKSITTYLHYNTEAAAKVNEFKAAATNLQNALVSAFAPLLDVVLPPLIQLVNWLARAVEMIGMFVAALSGRSTYKRLIANNEAAAKSYDKVGKAAKNAEMGLASFDKLENMTSSKDSGGDGSDLTASGMEDVAIDPKVLSTLDKIRAVMDKLKARAKELWNEFKKGFRLALGDVGPRLETIRKGLDQIRQAAADIWNDPEVRRAADNWANSLAFLLGTVAGTVSSIGLTIGANLIGGLGQYLEEHTPEIKSWLINMFDVWGEINGQLSSFLVSFGFIFEAFAGENGVNMTASLIGIFASAFGGITLLASKFGRDMITMITDPIIENQDTLREALDNTLGIISEQLEIVESDVRHCFEQINKAYDEHVKPLFDTVTATLTKVVGKVAEGYNKYIAPVMERLNAKLKEFSDKYFKPLMDSVLELFGKVIDIVNELWKAYVEPFVLWLAEHVMPVLAPIIETAGTIILGLFETVTTVIKGITDTLTALLEFLETGFTEGWDKAWKGLSSDFEEIWGEMGEMAKGAINTIIDGINVMLDGIASAVNAIADKINSLSFTVPEWSPIFAGRSWNPGLRHVSVQHVPKLADGAVIRGGNPFMAILGDQPAGQTNIEAPLSDMTDAMKEANREEVQLMREQNRLLQRILEKDGGSLTIRDVFNAVKSENDAYYRRTGREAFVH